jgi:nucleoid-associated protein YgaU
MGREALHMLFGGTDALEAFAALLLCERPSEPSEEAVRLAKMAMELSRDRTRGRGGTHPLPVLIPGDLAPFRTLYALGRERAKNARSDRSPTTGETKPAAAVRLLLALRHRQRAAVGLRYLIGMPRDSVGLVLGLPPRATDEVLRAGLGAIARGSRSKIDVRRNLRAAGTMLTENPQREMSAVLSRETGPRSVVRLLLAPGPFGLSEPDRSAWDAPPATVALTARPVYGVPVGGAPPPLPQIRVRARRRLAATAATLAAAIVVAVVFAVLPQSTRGGPVPLAVLPLAPSVVVPPPRPPTAGPLASVYVVRPGDTLWSIAARALGDPFRWQALWRLNAARRMNDGARFVDPDLIRPGWRLTLPGRGRRGG